MYSVVVKSYKAWAVWGEVLGLNVLVPLVPVRGEYWDYLYLYLVVPICTVDGAQGSRDPA